MVERDFQEYAELEKLLSNTTSEKLLNALALAREEDDQDLIDLVENELYYRAEMADKVLGDDHDFLEDK